MFENLIGANWRTTLTGIGSALMYLLGIGSALPYSFGAVADILSPEWKRRIAVTGIVCGAILQAINSTAMKDKNVTGGNKQNDV